MIRGGETLLKYIGHKFEDENFTFKHTGPGILSMANAGKLILIVVKPCGKEGVERKKVVCVYRTA